MFTRFRPCLRACEQIFQLPGGGFEPAHIPGAGALKAARWDGGNFHSTLRVTRWQALRNRNLPSEHVEGVGMINSLSHVLSLDS